MKPDLPTVAIDLTPVLPGGENGGAKIFVLDLVDRLAASETSTQFILLTHSRSHDELGALERPNVRRRRVIDERPPSQVIAQPAVALSFPGRVRRKLRSIFRGSPAPITIENPLESSGYAPGMLRAMNVGLLFCPFTAPTYFEPTIPTVCTIYDLQFNAYPEFFAADDVAHRRQTFVNACQQASALAAISEFTRKAAIDFGHLESLRVRTIHLRMTQRIGARHDEDVDSLSKWQLIRGRYLIYPANFWKHKNHEMLLTAFGVACRNGLPTDIRLVCTGAPGPRQSWLKDAAGAMGLGDRTLFPGFVSDEALSMLIVNSAGVVFPTLFEGFGLPIVEAMAAGVPVACSNTTSLPEVAAGAAMLFDPRIPTEIAEAMVDIVVDPDHARSLVERGLSRAAEFADGQRMCDEYIDLFRFAIAKSKRETTLTGIYEDGWVGPAMTISAAPAPGPQRIELDIVVPSWLPAPSVQVDAVVNGKPDRSQVFARSDERSLSFAMTDEGGVCEIRITPTFVPAQYGMGNDRRELSVFVATLHCHM